MVEMLGLEESDGFFRKNGTFVRKELVEAPQDIRAFTVDKRFNVVQVADGEGNIVLAVTEQELSIIDHFLASKQGIRVRSKCVASSASLR